MNVPVKKIVIAAVILLGSATTVLMGLINFVVVPGWIGSEVATIGANSGTVEKTQQQPPTITAVKSDEIVRRNKMRILAAESVGIMLVSGIITHKAIREASRYR
ncbi:MAG: hypothetical protein EYC62_04570 [Alphaproteobacteria bacterium]|nr:MAG: hypothetical protein EYC62_04570 [Alphaproteobacteria bacterium]